MWFLQARFGLHFTIINHNQKPFFLQIESLLQSIDEGGSHVALLSVAKVGICETGSFFEGLIKDFANDRRVHVALPKRKQ